MGMVLYLTFLESWELPFSKVIDMNVYFSVMLGSWQYIGDNGCDLFL